MSDFFGKGDEPDIIQPDPNALIGADQQANQITQLTPQGNFIAGVVTPTATGNNFAASAGRAFEVQETPVQKQLRQINEGTAVNLGQLAGTRAGQLPTSPLNFEGLPQVPGSIDFSQLPAAPGDLSGLRSRIEDATFNRQLSLIQPEFDRRRGGLETTLRNQGTPRGSSAFTQAQDRLDRSQGETLSRLAQAATQAGGAELSREFGLQTAARASGLGEALTQVDLARQARTGGIAERQALRTAQLGELTALLRGAPAFPIPQFGLPGGVNTLGAFGLAQNAQLAAAQQAQAQRSAGIGAGGDILGSLLSGAGAAGGFGSLFG